MRVVSSGVQYTPVKAAIKHICLPLLAVILLALPTGESEPGNQIHDSLAKSCDAGLFFDKYCKAYGNYSDNDYGCRPDGTPTLPGGNTDECWNPSLFLSLTLAGGHLTFTQAKAIDIVWDLIVGRGGQLLLAFLAYPVLRKSLTTAMERRPRRLSMVASLTFDKMCLWSLWEVMRDMHRRWSWRLLGYAYTITYLLAFGTIVSAMTGYQANMKPYYFGEDGSLVPASTLITTEVFMLQDDAAERVGFEPSTNVTDVDSAAYKALDACKSAGKT